MEGRTRLAFLTVLLSFSTSLGIGQVAPAVAGSQSKTPTPCVYDHDALRSPTGTCRPAARSYPRNVTGTVRRAIYDGALTFGVPYAVLLQIAKCESGLNPHASSGRFFGLFQFAPATFKNGAQAMLRNTGIRAKTYWNARDASYVTGYLFAVGGAQSWTCTRVIPGVK